MAYTQAARGTQYLNIGRRLSVVGAVIGIIDGFIALGEAQAMARRGELRSRVRTQSFMAGIGIGGGLLALVASSLVLIPLLLGVIMLIGAYLLVKLVPNNIATWLRRSLHGKEQDSFRFLPFETTEEEQESLKMVFSGIEFDMDVVRANEPWGGELLPPNWRDDMEHGGSGSLSLKVRVSFPKGLAGALTIFINYHPENGKKQYLGGSKYADNDVVRVDKNGQLLTSSDPVVVAEVGLPEPEVKGFILNRGEKSMTMLYETDLGVEGGALESVVFYGTKAGMVHQGKYTMEISK